MTGLDQLISRVGGRRNATIIVGTGGAGAVWLIGHRKNAKSRQAATATPVTVMAQGYSDTADDPTAVYTGYDQLQQEIDSLREQPGAPNPNPVPIPVSPPAPTPIAPTPAPPPVSARAPEQIVSHQDWGTPLPTYTPTPAQRYGPDPFHFTPPAGGYR